MTEMKLIYDGIYHWIGGCGATFQSKEIGELPKGTVRMIAGELFYAYSVHRIGFFRYHVSWCFVDKDKNAPAYLREFKKKVFCAES